MPHRMPRVVISRCCVSHRSISKDDILRRLRFNLGAYQKCYRTALSHRPGLQGRVTIRGDIDRSGTLRARVSQSNIGDPPLERCLKRTMEQVWFIPGRGMGRVIFTVPIRLIPTGDASPAPLPPRVTIERFERHAAAQLETGQVADAARSYRTLLRKRPRHPRACRWQVGLATARYRMAPWSDQLTWNEMRALARRPDRCKAKAELLLEWSAVQHRLAQRTGRLFLYEQTVSRYHALLDELLPCKTAQTLRFYLAETLFRLERFGEAGEQYLLVAAQGGKHAAESRYAATICATNLLGF